MIALFSIAVLLGSVVVATETRGRVISCTQDEEEMWRRDRDDELSRWNGWLGPISPCPEDYDP